MLGSVLLQAAGTAHESFLQFLGENLELFLTYTGVYNATPGHLIMILVGLLFIFLAIKYEFEPMLLIPIGFGILIGNIPFKDAGLQVGIYEQGSVLNILYQGVTSGWYPPLIFLGMFSIILFRCIFTLLSGPCRLLPIRFPFRSPVRAISLFRRIPASVHRWGCAEWRYCAVFYLSPTERYNVPR